MQDFTSGESRLFTYGRLHFQGSAWVRLCDLSLETSSFGRLMDDHRNIARLEKIFKIKGCLRLNHEYHIPVSIDPNDWGTRVRRSSIDGVIPYQLNVDRGYRLLALDHVNVILAARSQLDGYDPWWVVDVYVTGSANNNSGNTMSENQEGLQAEFLRSLRERFPNDRQPPDGLIYRNIRLYSGSLNGVRNVSALKHWWSVLENGPGSRKRSYLKTFLKRKKEIAEAFDSLLPIPGLWADMYIGLLHKLGAMRCDEPLICYLNLIKNTFSVLMDHDVTLLAAIDAVTVRKIKSRAPGVSKQDFDYLNKEMQTNRLFPCITNPGQRYHVFQRLKEISYPIPTLETFFQDRIYLEVGQTVMKKLIKSWPDMQSFTIDHLLGRQHRRAEGMSLPYTQGIVGDEIFDLWRFSLQYGFEMTGNQRRVDQKHVGIEREFDTGQFGTTSDLSSTLWQHFFTLAHRHGFDVPPLPETMPEMTTLPIPQPCDFPADDEDDLEIRGRCGRPFTDTVNADRFALSRDALAHPPEPRRMSAVFVRQAVFRAFFAYLNVTTIQSPSDSPNNFPGVSGGFAFEASENLDISANEDLSMPLDHTGANESSHTFQNVNTGQDERSNEVQRISPSYFTMHITLPGKANNSFQIPNKKAMLNQFFENLDTHGFEITRLGEERTLSYDECYSYYVGGPSVPLNAQPRNGWENVSIWKKRKADTGAISLSPAEAWFQEERAKMNQESPGFSSLAQLSPNMQIEEL